MTRVPAPPGISFDSDAYANDEESFEAYRKLYAVGSDVSLGERPFRARVRAGQLDNLILYDRRLDGVIHDRSERAGRDDFDHFAVHLILSGALAGSSGSGFDSAAAGDLVLADARRASRTEAVDLHLLTISVPRSEIVSMAGPPSWLHGRIQAPSTFPVLADLVQSVMRHGVDAPKGNQAALRRALMETLSGIIAEAGAARGRFVQADLDEREAVIGYITANLDNRDLNASVIAVGIGSSRSSIYRALRPLGGVAEVIMARRLAGVREALETGSTEPLSVLAARFGFTDESHLNRRFAQAFGQPAGAFRHLIATEADDRDARRLKSWITNLG